MIEINWPSPSSLVMSGLVILGVLLFAWDWVKPVFANATKKVKGLVSKVKPSTAQYTATSRAELWEQLWEACDTKNGVSPKAREVLNELWNHLKCPPKSQK